MNRKTRNKMLGISTIVLFTSVVLVAFLSSNALRRMAMLPAEEGLNTGVYGFGEGLYSELYSAKNPPDSPWELVSDDPHNYIIGYWHNYRMQIWNYYERSDVRMEISQPWHEQYREIKYWVDQGKEMVLVKGDVWIYHVDIVFSAVQKSEPGIYIFKDTPLWLGFVTAIWDQAIQDPDSGKAGKAWGAPISVYIESWTVDETGRGEHYKVEPSLEGRFISLYSEPSSAGATIDDLGLSEDIRINETLSAENEYAPSSRMRSTAFMRFILEDFGITTRWNLIGGIDGRDYPCVRYKLKVYYLALGTWTFTKEQQEQWEEREGEEEDYTPSWWEINFPDLSQWWSNMTGLDKMLVLGGIGVAVIVVIVAILAFSGVLMFLIVWLLTRRQGG